MAWVRDSSAPALTTHRFLAILEENKRARGRPAVRFDEVVATAS